MLPAPPAIPEASAVVWARAVGDLLTHVPELVRRERTLKIHLPPRRWGEPGHQGERTSPDAAAIRPTCLTPCIETFIPVATVAQLADRTRGGCVSKPRQVPLSTLPIVFSTAFYARLRLETRAREADIDAFAAALLIVSSIIQTRQIPHLHACTQSTEEW